MVLEYSAMAIVCYKNEILYTNEVIYGVERISLPKGHIENNETHIECAIRECFEETGIMLNKDEFIKELTPYSYEFNNPYNDNKLTMKTIYPCVFKIDEKRNTNISEKNILKADFMDIDSLMPILYFDNVRKILKELKS